MEQKYHTLELARLYENQGYYSLALENYSSLLAKDENNVELTKTVQRMKSKIENPDNAEKRIEKLCEEWISLLILKKRLAMYETIQKAL